MGPAHKRRVNRRSRAHAGRCPAMIGRMRHACTSMPGGALDVKVTNVMQEERQSCVVAGMYDFVA